MEQTNLPAHLPIRPDQQPWPPEIQDAFTKISDAHRSAIRVIRNEDGEPLDLRARSQNLRFQIIPIIEALEVSMPNYPDWITQCAMAIMSLSVDLMIMADSLESM
jgi:hypothetical protein